MGSHRFLLPLLGLLLNCSTVMAGPSENLPLTDPKVFAGRKLQDYPELFLVKRTKHINIFWSSRSTCTDRPSLDVVADQRNAETIQALLETKVEERIEKFEQFAKANLPSWEAKVSRRLYPMNIRIEMETPIICGGANQYNLGVYAGEGKPDIIVPDQLILESGGKLRNPSEAAGFVSVKMHELGHLIARSVGYPRFKGTNSIYQGPLEEAIADFVGFIGNENNPLIGQGLSDIIDNEYCSKLGTNLEPFEKAKIESICRTHSSSAMRDLRLPLEYQNLYKFPERHHIAGHCNALFYRLGKVVGLDLLFKSFMNQFFSMDGSVFDAEIYPFAGQVVRRVLSVKPEIKNDILKIMTDLKWRPAQLSHRRLVIGSPVQAEKAIQIEITPEQTLINDVFEFPVVNLNLKAGAETQFSLTYMGDFWKPKAALTKVNQCLKSEHDCKCFVDGDVLSVDAVYLDKRETVLRTSLQPVLTFGRETPAGCFKFGAD